MSHPPPKWNPADSYLTSIFQALSVPFLYTLFILNIQLNCTCSVYNESIIGLISCLSLHNHQRLGVWRIYNLLVYQFLQLHGYFRINMKLLQWIEITENYTKSTESACALTKNMEVVTQNLSSIASSSASSVNSVTKMSNV